jgi:hypothetical protein
MGSSVESRFFGQVAWLIVTFVFAILGTYGSPWMHFLVGFSGFMFVLGAAGWAYVPRRSSTEGMFFSLIATLVLGLIFGFWFFHWLGAVVVIALSVVAIFLSNSTRD